MRRDGHGEPHAPAVSPSPGGRLALVCVGDRLRISAADGQAIELATVDWRAFVHAGRRVIDRARADRRRSAAAGPTAGPGRRWTASDDAALRECWAAGASVDQLIERLDHNSGTIERRLFSLGLVTSKSEFSQRNG